MSDSSSTGSASINLIPTTLSNSPSSSSLSNSPSSSSPSNPTSSSSPSNPTSSTQINASKASAASDPSAASKTDAASKPSKTDAASETSDVSKAVTKRISLADTCDSNSDSDGDSESDTTQDYDSDLDTTEHYGDPAANTENTTQDRVGCCWLMAKAILDLNTSNTDWRSGLFHSYCLVACGFLRTGLLPNLLTVWSLLRDAYGVQNRVLANYYDAMLITREHNPALFSRLTRLGFAWFNRRQFVCTYEPTEKDFDGEKPVFCWQLVFGCGGELDKDRGNDETEFANPSQEPEFNICNVIPGFDLFLGDWVRVSLCRHKWVTYEQLENERREAQRADALRKWELEVQRICTEEEIELLNRCVEARIPPTEIDIKYLSDLTSACSWAIDSWYSCEFKHKESYRFYFNLVENILNLYPDDAYAVLVDELWTRSDARSVLYRLWIARMNLFADRPEDEENEESDSESDEESDEEKSDAE